MHKRHPDETNPFVPDEVNISDSMVAQERQTSFSETHWWIVATQWIVWTIIYMLGVASIHMKDSERLQSIMLTPLVTAVAPLLGAMLGGAQSWSFQVSLNVLVCVFPVPFTATILQWHWNPRHPILKIVRLLIWDAAWLIWFGSGIVPLAYAIE